MIKHSFPPPEPGRRSRISAVEEQVHRLETADGRRLESIVEIRKDLGRLAEAVQRIADTQAELAETTRDLARLVDKITQGDSVSGEGNSHE